MMNKDGRSISCILYVRTSVKKKDHETTKCRGPGGREGGGSDGNLVQDYILIRLCLLVRLQSIYHF